MTEDSVVALHHPGVTADALTEVPPRRSSRAPAEPVNDFETVTIAIY